MLGSVVDGVYHRATIELVSRAPFPNCDERWQRVDEHCRTPVYRHAKRVERQPTPCHIHRCVHVAMPRHSMRPPIVDCFCHRSVAAGEINVLVQHVLAVAGVALVTLAMTLLLLLVLAATVLVVAAKQFVRLVVET